MKNKIKQSGQPGFTLIEVMIVLAIIVIMAGIALASMVRSQSQQLFNNQFDQINSLIGNARSLAITGKGQLDYTDADHDHCNQDGAIAPDGTCTAPDYVTPANYGVNFNTTGSQNVVLFADLNPPSTGASGAKGRYDSGSSYSTGDDLKLGNIINLGNDYCIKLEDSTGASVTDGSILFSPNYADISFDKFSVTGTSPFLIIRLHDKTPVKRCKQIRIHKLAGIPEVEQCDAAGTAETCP
jgi:prepilin-type N-terminal cleavage/methylation domain-containing protein